VTSRDSRIAPGRDRRARAAAPSPRCRGARPGLVDVGAAEADPERPRKRGLAAARVRAGMRAAVAAQRAQGTAPAPADRGRQGYARDGGHPGGHQVRHVVGAGGGPPRPSYLMLWCPTMARRACSRPGSRAARQPPATPHSSGATTASQVFSRPIPRPRGPIRRRTARRGRARTARAAASCVVKVVGRGARETPAASAARLAPYEHRPGRRGRQRRTGQRPAPGQSLPGPASGGGQYGAGQSEQGAAGTACRPRTGARRGPRGAEHRDRVAGRGSASTASSGAEQQPGGEPGPSRHQRSAAGGGARTARWAGQVRHHGGPSSGSNHAPWAKDRRPGVLAPGSEAPRPSTASRSWLT
jgi:hypothetical protein